MKAQKIEDRLLATHVSENPEFETACLMGDANKILEIVDSEMNIHNLHTKGSEKLRVDILKLIKGQTNVPTYIGKSILAFVWNARLSGTGLAVK